MLQATLHSRDELHYTHVTKDNNICHCHRPKLFPCLLRFFLIFRNGTHITSAGSCPEHLSDATGG